jgi:hypothetical protein
MMARNRVNWRWVRAGAALFDAPSGAGLVIR